MLCRSLIQLGLIASVSAGLGAADPNTNPWPASGPVGIGTTTPTSFQPNANFVVTKAAAHNYMYVNADLAYDAGLVFGDTTNGVDGILHRPPGSRDLRLYTFLSGDVMSLTQGGNVGVGITAPVARLHVVQPNAGLDSLYVTNSVSNNVSRLTAATGFSNYLDWYSGTGAGALIFRNAGTENVRIDSGGNIGIGITAPVARVHMVQPAAGLDSLYVTNSVSNNVTRLTAATGFSNYLDWYTGTGTGDLIFRNAGAEQLRVNSAGNVLIGASANPGGAGNLVVHGGAIYGTSLTQGYATLDTEGLKVYNAENTGGNPVRLGSAYNAPGLYRNGTLQIRTEGQSLSLLPNVGNVGVGTTAPDRLFQVVGTNPKGIEVATASGAARCEVSMTVDATTGYLDAYNVGTGPLSLSLNPNGGNVGIGTSSPTNKLTVIGTISAKEIKVTATGADYVFDEGYRLRPLDEVAQYVAREKHLPDIAPAKQMQAEGMPVSEVVTKQLAKIEELTLYAIQERRDCDEIRQENARLKAEGARLTQESARQGAVVAQLAARLEALEAKLVASTGRGR